MNLATNIEGHDASRVALIAASGEISYGTVRARAAAVRARLIAEGIGAGDRVLIGCGNEPEFVFGALGALGVGAVAVPVSPRGPIAEFMGTIELIQPAAVLIGPSLTRLTEARDDIEAPMIEFTEIDDVDGAGPDIVDRDPDDLAFLMLTSGITGVSKAAMLSHGNLAFVQDYTCDGGPDSVGPDDVVFGALPFAHIFGLNVVLLAALRVGASCVLQERFEANESLDLIKRHGITRIAAVPPMWRQWAEAEGPDDRLASVTYGASGAAALPVEVFHMVRDRYGIEIAEGYGLTETSPIVTNHRGIPIKAGSVGKVMPGIDVVIVEDDGEPVGAGDTGEIVVRGPGVFKGYLDAPDATASVLTDDGWFWTGDAGGFDDDGYLYLVDRLKDIVIVSGFNVYPAEVETILKQHPGVTGAVVVGRDSERTGEAVTAYVIAQADTEELNTFVRSKLSGYKCPTEYHFVDELPVTAAGKVVRKELRN